MTTNGMDVLARIARLRREFLGLDQDELATRGGPAVTTVGKIERGAQKRFAARTLQQMDRALGWPLGTSGQIVNAPAQDWWDDQRGDYELQWVEWAVPDMNAERPYADTNLGALLAELTFRVKVMENELVELRKKGANDAGNAEAEKIRVARTAPDDDLVQETPAPTDVLGQADPQPSLPGGPRSGQAVPH